MTRIIKLHGKYFELQHDTPEKLEKIMEQPATQTIARQIPKEEIPNRQPDQVVG